MISIIAMVTVAKILVIEILFENISQIWMSLWLNLSIFQKLIHKEKNFCVQNSLNLSLYPLTNNHKNGGFAGDISTGHRFESYRRRFARIDVLCKVY